MDFFSPEKKKKKIKRIPVTEKEGINIREAGRAQAVGIWRGRRGSCVDRVAGHTTYMCVRAVQHVAAMAGTDTNHTSSMPCPAHSMACPHGCPAIRYGSAGVGGSEEQSCTCMYTDDEEEKRAGPSILP